PSFLPSCAGFRPGSPKEPRPSTDVSETRPLDQQPRVSPTLAEPLDDTGAGCPGILLRGGALWLPGIPGLQGMAGWSVVGATGEQGAWPGQAMCPSCSIVE